MKMRHRDLLGVVALLVFAAACGRGESKGIQAAKAAPTTAIESSAASPLTLGCRAGGTSIRVIAKDSTFDKKCLAARANTAFTIRLVNTEHATVHNLAIYTEDPEQPIPNP